MTGLGDVEKFNIAMDKSMGFAYKTGYGDGFVNGAITMGLGMLTGVVVGVIADNRRKKKESECTEEIEE